MAVNAPILLGQANSVQSVGETLAAACSAPTAGATLHAFIAVANNGTNNTIQPSVSDTDGRTWAEASLSAQVPWNGDATFGGRVALWSVNAGGSPGAFTVTVDGWADASTGVICFAVFEVTADGTVALAQPIVTNAATKGGGGAESHTSAALASAATTGNRIIACFGAGDEGPMTVPTGWTALINQNPGTEFTHVAVFDRNDFTGTDVTVADLGQVIGWAGAVLFELEEVGGGLVEAPVDSTTITDTAVVALDRAIGFSDDVGISDTVTFTAALVQDPADNVPIGDVVLVEHDVTVEGDADQVGISDSAQIDLSSVGVFADDVGVTDAAVLAVAIARSLIDDVGITDSTLIDLAAAGTFMDNVGITDAAAVAAVLVRGTVDAVGIEDNAIVQLSTPVIAFVDPIGITDSVSILVPGTSPVICGRRTTQRVDAVRTTVAIIPC